MVTRTKVLIADDHSLVRRGTREILQQEEAIEVVGEAVDGMEAVELTGELQPDVVLMDIGIPGLNGIEATRQIKSRWPEVEIVILTVHDDDEYVWQAIQVGASGYLLKDVADSELINAVRTVATGGAVLGPTVTEFLIRRVRGSAREAEAAASQTPLTARELEVLQLAASGFSNRQIGVALDLSPRTVEVHMHRVFQKLDAASRTEAVVVAARRGLIELEEQT